MIPRATYRLQFHKDFTFAQGAALADYLAALGVSHVYASPILAARPGSRHGYDVVDHSRINPELGGEEGLRTLSAALRKRGLGIIVDIVPNHMAVGTGNRWWQDVLTRGRHSAYASTFDIDWDAPGLEGKVFAPFLDGAPAALLRAGELTLAREMAGWCFCYFDLRFPLRPEDQEYLDARGAAPSSLQDLETLLARQHYVLADWREADARINWRRFFDITGLAALRMTEPAVFEAVHAKIFALYGEGLIDGVRVDHVDGLADPRAYCRALRARLRALGREPWLIVEKILAEDEMPASDWDCDGTTGYDFMNEAAALLHDAEGEPVFDALWRKYGGRNRDFPREESEARREILTAKFPAQLAATVRAFARTAPRLSSSLLERSLCEIIVALRCYRDYSTGHADSPGPGRHFLAAVERAAVAAPELARTIDMIAVLFSSRTGDTLLVDALRRFHQLSATVAAKAVEDTAFYRYGRLLSRNDVGFNPATFAMTAEVFHRRAEARAARFPATMLTTATHDHKRGEDARARLAVLAAKPGLWEEFVAAAPKPDRLDTGDVYQLLQTLAGAWPEGTPDEDFANRIEGWCGKHLREAKLHSSWTSPDRQYENGFRSFARDLILAAECGPFRQRMESFLANIKTQAEVNSLIQTVLRYTVPGIPDLYQGCEFPDFSLVDPDNRRPVDFAARIGSLARRPAAGKQRLIAALLAARRRDPDLWARGDYVPLDPGPDGRHVLGFIRTHGQSRLTVLAAREPQASLSATIVIERDSIDLVNDMPVKRGEKSWAEILGFSPVSVIHTRRN